MSRPIVSNDSAKTIVTPDRVDVRDHPLERVAERQERQRHVVSVDIAARRARLDVRDEVGVRQHHALGLARRARTCR